MGPSIEKETAAWLDAGGSFPEVLRVRFHPERAEPSVREFEILDRGADGTIALLRSSRRGNKSFVLRVREKGVGGREYAAKLAIPADYDGKSPLLEMGYAYRLQGGGALIHAPEAIGLVERFSGEPETEDRRDWLCFLSAWLNGRTIAEVLRDSPGLITPSLAAKVAIQLISAVRYIEAKGLKHDDLHLGNLMLVDPDPDLARIDAAMAYPRLTVIDTGSVKDIQRSTRKDDDDWSSSARCLSELYNSLHRRRSEASRYPDFMRDFRAFIEQLAEDDHSRFFPDPGDYVARLRDLEETISVHPRRTKVFSPFHAISAEHLASDEILLQLFVKGLPWIKMVSEPDPCLVFGPRGCGKSMLFRYLSARTHLSTDGKYIDKLKSIGFFGVYIGCSSDLGNDLLWLAREPGRVEARTEQIVTYFNLVLARELLRALSAASRAPDASSFLGLSEKARSEITAFVRDSCGENFSSLRFADMDQLQSCVDALESARLKLGQWLLSGEGQAPFSLGAVFIRDLCRLASRQAPGLETLRVTFLLDDYTSGRLSPRIQKVLNSVVWQRDPSFAFKVSSEPYGFTTSHVDGAQIDEHREFTPIDAGSLTLGNDNRPERRKFITELLDRRLEAAKYKGTVATLIGDSEDTDDVALSRKIRFGVDGSRAGRKSFYHGIHVLSDSWSGDVSNVLHMVREMFVVSGVKSSSIDRIRPEVQHDSIVKISKGLRARVRSFHPYGDMMDQIMSAFGDTAAKLLVSGVLQNSGENEAPQRRYRIEMSLPPGATIDSELSKEHNGEQLIALRKELVRRGVFIELPESRGKESAGHRTLRWELRASFLPSFGVSLIRKDYVDVKRVEDFVEFLTNPGKYMEQVWLRYGVKESEALVRQEKLL